MQNEPLQEYFTDNLCRGVCFFSQGQEGKLKIRLESKQNTNGRRRKGKKGNKSENAGLTWKNRWTNNDVGENTDLNTQEVINYWDSGVNKKKDRETKRGSVKWNITHEDIFKLNQEITKLKTVSTTRGGGRGILSSDCRRPFLFFLFDKLIMNGSDWLITVHITHKQ